METKGSFLRTLLYFTLVNLTFRFFLDTAYVAGKAPLDCEARLCGPLYADLYAMLQPNPPREVQ